MSLYNMIRGTNISTFIILPMLGKHPDQYPRFRDCWIGRVSNSEENDEFGIPLKKQDISKRIISVYTRVGGGNREDYDKEIKELVSIPEYIRDFDDSFDSTYATFEFNVPDKWKNDYDTILEGRLSDVSDDYIKEIKRVFPKIADKIDELFSMKNE